MGGDRKQFRILGDEPLVVQTLRVFDEHPEVDALVVAAPEEDCAHLGALLSEAGLVKVAAVVPGGATRQESVFAALASAPPAAGVVLVHDAVRPFVTAARVSAVIEAVRRHGAASLAIPVVDTLRRGRDGFLGETVEREGLFRMQTPQGFRRDLFLAAHEMAREAAYRATDDVALVRKYAGEVRLVEGDPLNLKITTPADWELAQLLWECRERVR